MFLGVLSKVGVAIFDYFCKNCLKISPLLTALKLDNIPSIRSKMIWSVHVQVAKQDIRLH